MGAWIVHAFRQFRWCELKVRFWRNRQFEFRCPREIQNLGTDFEILDDPHNREKLAHGRMNCVVAIPEIHRRIGGARKYRRQSLPVQSKYIFLIFPFGWRIHYASINRKGAGFLLPS